MTARLESRSFRAMGTILSVSAATVAGDTADAHRALAAGHAEVAARERALSQFDPRSDLSRLNAARGEWTAINVRLLEGHATALAITPAAEASAYVRERPGLGAVVVCDAGAPIVVGAERFAPVRPRVRVRVRARVPQLAESGRM